MSSKTPRYGSASVTSVTTIAISVQPARKIRWLVECEDGTLWEADLSRADAEIEQVVADRECVCGGRLHLIRRS